MPILIMGLVAFGVFGTIGGLLLAAEISEHRSRNAAHAAPKLSQSSATLKH